MFLLSLKNAGTLLLRLGMLKQILELTLTISKHILSKFAKLFLN